MNLFEWLVCIRARLLVVPHPPLIMMSFLADFSPR